jgi:selenocysteine-specific elongation factor
VQVRLEQPVAVAKGDLFILRSFERTIGGGEVIGPYAKRHRRLSPSVVEGLVARGNDSPADSLLAILKSNEPAGLGQISRLSNLSPTEAYKILERLTSTNRVLMLGEEDGQALFFSINGWNALVDAAKKFTQDYHRQFPLRKGMPKEELRSRLKTSTAYFDSILQKLLDERVLVRDGVLVSLTSHEIKLSMKQRSEVEAFLSSLSQNPYYPSRETVSDAEILNMLINDGRVIRLKDEIVFLASTYDDMVEHIIEHLRLKKEVTVVEVRDMFRTSRKNAQVLLEYMDAQKITPRVGDVHVLHPEANFAMLTKSDAREVVRSQCDNR